MATLLLLKTMLLLTISTSKELFRPPVPAEPLVPFSLLLLLPLTQANRLLLLHDSMSRSSHLLLRVL